MNKIIPTLKFLIGWPLSILALFFVVRLISGKLPEIIPYIKNISLFYFAISILLFFLYYISRSILWKELLKDMGYEVPYLENAYKFAASELKRFVPGNVWSLLSRGSLFTQMGIDKEIVVKGLLLEVQLIIAGCMLVSSFSFAWILDAPDLLKDKLSAILPITFIAVFIYFFVLAYIFKKRYNKKISFVSSLYLPGLPIRSKINLTILSFVVFTIFGLANFFILLSLFPENISQVIALSSFFTLALLIGYLSFITPMGLGVREGVVTVGLLKIMTITNSGFFAIFSRVVLIVSELSYLLLIFLIYKLRLKANTK